MKETIFVGTRGSRLAQWQANTAIALLKKHFRHRNFVIKIYSSAGDQEQEKPLPAIGGKGVFTEALDRALLNKEIDVAVHSLKDLPIHGLDSLKTAAVLERENACDVVVSKNGLTLDQAPKNAIIGTSSTRRSAQLLAINKDFVLHDIRGNVDTRIKKVLDKDGPYFATLLAYAGVKRLNMLEHCAEMLDMEVMLPAPAQGSIAIQCVEDSEAYFMCEAVNHEASRLCTEAERGFLFGLGGGCSMPIAAFGEIARGRMSLRGRVISLDGCQKVDVNTSHGIENWSFDDAFRFGIELAQEAIAKGAKDLLSCT